MTTNPDVTIEAGHRLHDVDLSRTDRERSLDALHVVELCAGSPAPRRERQWLESVRAALNVLQQALATQYGHSHSPDSVLGDIARDQPRLHRRVQRLRQRSESLVEEVAALRQELDAIDPTHTIDVSDVRQRLERLANEMRYLRARETDVVYEAYSVDLGAGD